jgi:uncharacterized protein YbjT (DUF2867 family)
VLTRDAARGRRLRDLGAEIVVADLRDPRSLEAAVAGATYVITTANAFLGGRGSASVAAIDKQGTRNLIDAARKANVQRFVFTSALLPQSYRSIDYFAMKMENEDYLRRSGVSFTILRPTAFMETWAHLIGDPLVKGQPAPIFGSGRTPINFVAVEDVAAVACLALDDPRALNAVVEIGGPQNLTFLDVAEVFERVTGKTARRRRIPVPVMRALSFVMRPFNPVFARSVKAGALAAVTPQPFDPTAMLARYPVQLTTLEEWVRQKYGREASHD